MNELLARMYKHEINFAVSAFWDGGFDLKIGDDWNGYKALGAVATVDEIAPWFVDNLQRLYPDIDWSFDPTRKEV